MNKYRGIRVLNGKVSFLIDQHAVKVFAGLAIGAAILFLISTGMGEMRINPLTVLQIFFGGGSEMERLVVQSFRLPRIIVALMVGMALAVAGGILQGMIRNPLASPDILGITGGASVAVVGFLAIKEVARRMAILPQAPLAPEGLTVLQLVKQGRFPYQNWLKQWTEEDEQKVMRALKATGIEQLQDRPVDSLSGGQRQRAWIAMTLAQDTDIILLDEPTTYLDMTHQIEILDLLFELNEQEGRTILMVLHDLNLACRYAHNIVAIKDQRIYAQGKPEHVVNCQLVKNVFGMDCDVAVDPLFGTPLCIPYGKGRIIKKGKSGHDS